MDFNRRANNLASESFFIQFTLGFIVGVPASQVFLFFLRVLRVFVVNYFASKIALRSEGISEIGA